MKDKPQEHERMLHIIQAIDKILNYTKGVDFEQFRNHEMMKDAVMKNFEIVGEAAYHVSNETKKKYNEIAWIPIQALRHILVHDYYEVNPERLWNIKESYLEDLKKEMQRVLKEEYDI